MKSKKLKIALYIILFLILSVIGTVLYFYQQGRVNNYVPPTADTGSSKEQVVSDFTLLSRAIEAYNGMNLKYPDSLSQLQPDFITKLPVEPGSGHQYIYQTDGTSKYKIAVSDPNTYQLKEFAVENGKVTEQ